MLNFRSTWRSSAVDRHVPMIEQCRLVLNSQIFLASFDNTPLFRRLIRSGMTRGETPVNPASIGFSASRLARLDAVMKQRYVDTGRLPVLLTMISRRGPRPHVSMAGHSDLERGKPMREDAIFRIYSMSKPITAVALMMLVEEGLIGLDDAVHTHIPSWRDLGVYASGMPSLLADTPPSFLTDPV